MKQILSKFEYNTPKYQILLLIIITISLIYNSLPVVLVFQTITPVLLKIHAHVHRSVNTCI